MSKKTEFQAFINGRTPTQYSYDDNYIYEKSSGKISKNTITAYQNYLLRHMSYDDLVGPADLFEAVKDNGF